jgi:hypothetical protein
MSNPYYNFTVPLAPGTLAKSGDVNSQFGSLGSGFDLLAVCYNINGNSAEISQNSIIRLKTVDPATISSAFTGGAGAQISDGAGQLRPAGLGVRPSLVQNANYTIPLLIMGSILLHTAGGLHTYTTPSNAANQVPTGYWINIRNAGGTLSVAPGAGVTLSWFTGAAVTTGTRTIAVGGDVTLVMIDVNNWYISGIGIS